MTCLACSNNGAALNGLCIQIPNAIVWLCRSYVNSGNTIYFCPQLLKCKENKQGFHEKGNKKKPLCINLVGMSAAESIKEEDVAIGTSFWPERSAVMIAGIHLLVLPPLCRDLVLTVEPGKNLRCCYPHKNLLSSKTITISTLGEDLEDRWDLLLVT